MGLFKKFKEALPTIGGVVGFALGGPGGSAALGAALGSGVGSLAAGKSVEDSLKNAAIGGAFGAGAKMMGFGMGSDNLHATAAERLLPSYKGKSMFGAGSKIIGRLPVPEPGTSLGSTGGLGSLSLAEKGLLGVGGAALLSDLFKEPEEETAATRPYPTGEAFGTVVGRSGKEYRISDPTEMKQYADELKELQDPSYDYLLDPYKPVTRSSGYAHGGDVHAGGGEVDGPGTGTSDSVPARLSDGEFVLTAKAVRGAGAGDRDLGAARLYDMMSELEATA